MKQIAIVYHSSRGHIGHFAGYVAEGARKVSGTEASLLKAEQLIESPEDLVRYDGIIWGSPTHLGGVSGPFKTFMDSTGGIWRKQLLKGKLAAGFTISSSPSGDKQTTLISMVVFSMQHGMIWVGNPIIPENYAGVPPDQSANRLGSWTGAMAQVDHTAPADGFVPGDLKTAMLFGENFARTLTRPCDGHIAG